MKIKELMERLGINNTGIAGAYIKDALEEMNMIAETHVTTTRFNIAANKRYYPVPQDCIKITDIRCKNHLNSKGEYRSIPRMIGEPAIEDADQELR
jgi:hypothetical protein|tara:strand:- start:1281 stop:1568 length:288 start_codon:yes stop_codon:yes gene_type:complete